MPVCVCILISHSVSFVVAINGAYNVFVIVCECVCGHVLVIVCECMCAIFVHVQLHVIVSHFLILTFMDMYVAFICS